MPLTTLISLNYRCRYSKIVSEAERQREIALLSTSHLASLGKLLSRLTSDSGGPELPNMDLEEIQARADELNAGLHVLGILIAAIADQAYGAIEESGSAADVDQPPVEIERQTPESSTRPRLPFSSPLGPPPLAQRC